MKRLSWIALVTCLFVSFQSNPLDPTPEAYCGADVLHQQWLDQHPNHAKKQQEFDAAWAAASLNFSKSSASYTLPVVVHIIHQNGAENISDAIVQTGMDHLNAAFANMGYYDQGTGVDTDIEFCLAIQDPDGNATTGINRVQDPLTEMDMNTDDLDLKNLIRWDPTQYINIWLVREICSGNGCGVAGYAYFPSAHGSDIDGIVMEAQWFGSTEGNSGVQIHEMGHYLGLYHTFQGGCLNNDCTIDGDQVCDTPPDQSTVAVFCGGIANSCSTDSDSGFAIDQNDMYINYMDYGDLDCYSAFTQGQADRMVFSIENTRESLLTSNGCNDPCFSPLTASFTASGTSVNVGTTVNFQNTSVGATTYEWQIDGLPFSSNVNASYTFLSEGTFAITLVATNADPNCASIFEVEVEVSCPVVADFQVSSTDVQPGTAVYFTNTSQNASSYTWYLDDVPVSTDFNWDNVFDLLGTFDIQLVASDGVCMDTSALTVVTVSTTGLSQTGLPIWPLSPANNDLVHGIDWRNLPPTTFSIFDSPADNFGNTGAAFDGCGNLAFFAIHSGSSDQDQLFLYLPDGTELLTDNTPNGPGMNAVRAGQELQVIRVPQTENEWYIIYNEWSSDVGAPLNNAGYNAARLAYSRVRLEGTVLTVLEKDIILTDNNGNDWTYNDGMAVSRTANGSVDQHFLYAPRRAFFGSTISVDRFLITSTGITFEANTGEVPAAYWNLTHAGSHLELSPTEDRIALCSRNQFNNWEDYLIFNATTFSNTDVQVIIGNDLVLVADGTANDQSNVLPYSAPVEDVADDNNLPLQFLQNFDRKLSRFEFSPNGRFLYVTAGGYSSGGLTNITYLAQIDLEAAPLEVRMQIQTTPFGTYNGSSGTGCQLSAGTCDENYRAISEIETGFDGNLYFTKRGSNQLFVIPDPNNVMPQNLVPSDIDLSTPNEPNITLLSDLGSLPDQIDGFNYLLSQFQEVALVVNGTDCSDNCLAPYEVQVQYPAGELLSLTVENCPDTFFICVDTTEIYRLYQPDLDITYDSAIVFGMVQYPGTATLFDFSDQEGCVEVCGNGIDDDGDGLIDCADPDLVQDCCCLNPLVLELGPDQTICDNGVAVFDAGSGFTTYLWSDNSNGQLLSTSEPGLYWLLATDQCGIEYQDTVAVLLDPGTVLNFGPDQEICQSETVTLSASGFDAYQWSPTTYLNGCNDCASVTIQPDSSITYYIIGNTVEGCYSVDTVQITVLDTVFQQIDTLICDGSTLIFDGVPLNAGTSTPFVYQAANGCDSTILVNVAGGGGTSYALQLDTFACAGSTVIYDGTAIPAGSTEVFEYQTVDGCDSVITVVVESLPLDQTQETILLCPGDSALVFGNIETQAGDYTQVFAGAEGCDSTHTITLELLDALQVIENVDPSCKDESTGQISLNVSGGLPPYSFIWSPSAANAGTLSDLPAGNYAYTVTDANNCTLEGSLLLDVSLLPSYELVVEDPTCYGDEDGSLSIESTDPGLSFSLDGGVFQTSPVFPFLEGGNYVLEIQDAFGCIYEELVVVEAPQELTVALPPDTTIQLGESLDVIAQVNTFDSLFYSWVPGEGLSCVDCPALVAAPVITTLYTVMVEDTAGCRDLDEILIRVEKPRDVYIPNAFSPDLDGINDEFRLYAGQSASQVLRLLIFDRWGELVYENSNFDPNGDYGWDGTFRGQPLNPAVYTYMVEILFLDGQVELYTGTVQLLR